MGAEPVLAYSSFDKIVILPDSNVFDNYDADGDGVVAFYEYDNDVLGLNIAKWLVGSASDPQFQVTDVNIIRGEFVGDWFQEIKEVDELKVGDVFVIKIEVTNVGSETEEVFNLHDWDLSPQTRVEVIGTPSFCLCPFNLQPGESAILYPFCLSEAFEAEEVGWVTINVHEYGGYTFNFEIGEEEEGIKFRGVVQNAPEEPYYINVLIDEVLLDPEKNLSVGDSAAIDACYPPACDVDWPLHNGDRVEVYAKHYQYEYCWGHDVCVWIYSKDNPNDGYLNIITQAKRVHNIDTGEDFATIQEAIDDSGTDSGDTILVYPRTYTENVDVYKSLTIKSTSGNPEDTIVQAAVSDQNYQNVFTVTADDVKIDGFTIREANYLWCSGILLAISTSIISNNTFEDNAIGIWTHQPSGDDNTIRNNNFASTSGYSPSIALYIESAGNKIYLNDFMINSGKGEVHIFPLSGTPRSQ
ncbi:MAG: Cell surface glycoprotein precursor [Candidatus Syntrophoarchaeum sp. GoM_oil]|nr:MAG: Cell surface glycoprotein precursor [Candidatus Syntrophoarchaeum sp. GoM_oil]